MMRIVIIGGPKTGKTTLANISDIDIIMHTDDAQGEWSKQSDEVVNWLNEPGPWIIEGISVVRALRKWLQLYEWNPCDKIIYLSTTYEALTPGQESMGKGVQKIWLEICDNLASRGVTVEYR